MSLCRLVWLLLVASICSALAGAMPLTVKEISLMLRSGYSDSAVLNELSVRRFADTFDPAVEQQLVKAGARESLIKALRSGVYQLSSAEIAAATERRSAQSTKVSEAIPNLGTDNQRENNHGVSPPSNAPIDAQRGGSMYDHLKDDLVYWHDGSLLAFDNEVLEKKKLYLLFFSAIWSKEGRQFTPRLVDYYNRIVPVHPELEVIFFSADRSAFAMENYISQTNMPWPAVAFDKRGGKAGAIQESLVHQLPRLILANAAGKILSDSGENKPDFDKVLVDLDRVLTGNK